MAQVKNTGLCNTKLKVPSRIRNYTFTLNNYTEEDIKTIPTLGADYVFQEETGAGGTPHLQGILMFKNAVSFSKLKRMLPTAHLEAARNKIASMRYCSKEDTRTGDIYANVEIPRETGTAQVNRSESSDEHLERIKDMIERGKITTKFWDEHDVSMWACEYGCKLVCKCNDKKENHPWLR
jgi:hypothetical protein